MTHDQPSTEQPFSQGNKLTFRATPAQAARLAQILACTGQPLSAVLRDALDLYLAHHHVADDPVERCSDCEAPLDDGEGWDGRCGSCADRCENDLEPTG